MNSEVKNEGLEVVDVRAIVTSAFVSMIEAALGMKAPDCAPPAFIQSAIDRAIDRINSEALAGYAVRDARIAALEDALETERMRLAACGTAALGYFDGCADEYKSASLDDVLKLRAELARVAQADAHYQAEALRLASELAAIKAQEPVAYVQTMPTAGHYPCKQRLDRDNGYTIPLYADPVAKQVVMQSTNFTASNGEQRNPRYQGQFEGETHDQAAYRLHWVTAAIESERLNATDQAEGESK